MEERFTAAPVAIIGRRAASVVALAVAMLALGIFGAQALAAPANDNFASAQALTGNPATVNGTTAAATRQTGEPDHDDSGAYATVWYTWTAPASGAAVFDACDFESDRIGGIAVYTGATLTGLTERASGYCRAVGQVSSGTTYRIAVASYTSYTGAFSLDVRTVSPPANDNFASSATISIGNTNGTTAGATFETNEPNPFDWDARATVWYQWTPAQDQLAVFDACDDESSIVDSLSVYTGSSLSGLTERGEGFCRASVQVTAGVTYRIAVASYPGDWGSFVLKLSTPAPPANDAFSAAATVTGSSFSGTTLGATSEPGEPDHGNSGATATVWYTWTPSSSGTALIGTCVPDDVEDLVSAVSVYQGSSLGSLTEAGSGYCQAVVAVQAGVTYRIAIASRFGYWGSFDGTINLSSSPANDDFESASAIAGTSVGGTTSGATRQSGEPDHFWSGAYATVWYTWTPSESGIGYLDACQGDVYTVDAVALYTGSTLATLNERRSGYCRVTVAVTAGQTYRIAVASYPSHWGEFTLAARVVQPPANDAFSAAQTITGASVDGSTIGASRQPSEPDHYDSGAQATVWYKWTAPQTGRAAFDACGTDYSVGAIAVYTGSALNSLALRGEDYCEVKVDVTAGTTYRIAIASYDDWEGFFTLGVNLLVPPPNDDFAAASTLAGNPATASGNTDGATRQPGEPSHYLPELGIASVWYKWTAPQDGSVTMDVCANYDSILAVYTGNSLTSLDEETSSDDARVSRCDDWASGVNFEATAGTTYWIAVAGYSYGDTGDFDLRLSFEGREPVKVGLSVEKSGSGSGTVVSDPSGIDCGSACQASFNEGSTVSLTANPAPGSVFGGWQGDCSGTGPCSVTLDGGSTVGAVFDKSETTTPPPPPPTSTPELAAPVVKPRSVKVKAGRKAVVNVTVRNVGTAAAQGVKVCASVPARLRKKVKVPGCRNLGSIPAGASRKALVPIKTTAKAKGSVKVTLKVTSRNAGTKVAGAKLKIKAKRRR